MNPLYVLLVPAVASLLCAMYVKYRHRKYVDVLLIALIGVCLLVNIVLVRQMLDGQLSVVQHILQMTACVAIVPLATMFFARKVGNLTLNITMMLLWLLFFVTFIPDIIIRNPFESLVVQPGRLQPFAIYVISHGQVLFGMYTSDFVVLLQSLIATTRFFIFVREISMYNLQLNKKAYFFIAYWVMVAAFICGISTLTLEEMQKESVQWFYILFYTIDIVVINVLIIIGYDITPVQTEQGRGVPDIDAYLQTRFKDMAMRMQYIIEEGKHYADPKLTAEQVVAMLNTNRTYFAQMMKHEWNMTFLEYLSNVRLLHAQQMLRDDAYTLTDIATECGFTDSNYMGRKFKARYGVTPKEWRKQYRK